MKQFVRLQQTIARQGKSETSFALLFRLNAKVRYAFLLVVALLLVGCSDDDEHAEPLTQSQAWAYLQNVWAFTIDGHECVLAPSDNGSLLLRQVGDNGQEGYDTDANLLSPNEADNYVDGYLDFLNEAGTRVYYRSLTAQTVSLSLDGTTWATARPVDASTAALTRLQAIAILCTGYWTAEEFALPLPAEAQAREASGTLHVEYQTADNVLALHYEEERHFTLEGEEKVDANQWSYTNGKIEIDPNYPSEAYNNCRILFGEYGNQIIEVRDLSPAGASLTGFSYGSNFRTAKFQRSVSASR